MHPRIAALLLVAPLLVAVASCSGAPDSGAPSPAAVDPAAVEAHEALIVEWVGEVRGGGSADLSASSFLGRIDADRNKLERVRAIDVSALSREQAIDHVLMIGLLESRIRDAEHRRSWENDPSLYVPAGRIGRRMEGFAAGQPEAVPALTEALEDVPTLVRQARENLSRPPRRFVDEGLFQLSRTLATLRVDAVEMAAEALGEATEEEARELRRLGSAIDAAVAALGSYEDFLQQEVLPRADGDWAIGREHYDFLLRTRWFLDDDAEAILRRGWEAFEVTEAEAQQVAERIEPGRHWTEVYETLKDDHPAIDGIKAAYQARMDEARAFVREHQVVTLPEGETVITVDTPPAMRRSSPFGTFQTVGPFGEGLQGRLVLTPIEGWLDPEQQAERLRSHHTAWIPVIAVHEAYPGHHVHALKTNENPGALRRVVSESIFGEGWGLFTEQLMYELGFLKGDDVRLTILRNRLWRAARVILDVSLHTGQMSVEEAVDFLVERVRFERYAAELEVAMYPRRPTYVLGYLIGMQEIEAIRDEWVARNGEPEPPSELYDQLLRIGSLPPALVRAELLGDPIPQR